MIVVQRRNKIKEILFQERSVKVSDLVKEFQVSEETIRRDLNRLEEEGLIVKNYGGAILADELQVAMTQIPRSSSGNSSILKKRMPLAAKRRSWLGRGKSSSSIRARRRGVRPGI
ncbi:DeoR family transcriptional regulator [Paenibacillus sp. CC-CFT747]|nr:DeoR family transcriptional regulator [Paenibacillus sp. CC-CFT747]